MPIAFAVGASIISVIATSSGAAAAYVRDRLTNLRVGMFLEIATTLGALIGARLLVYLSNKVLRFIFLPVVIIASLEMILHGLGIGPF